MRLVERSLLVVVRLDISWFAGVRLRDVPRTIILLRLVHVVLLGLHVLMVMHMVVRVVLLVRMMSIASSWLGHI